MNIFSKRLIEPLNMVTREHYPVDDCEPMSSDVFREAPLDEVRLEKLKAVIFEVFFGAAEEREERGGLRGAPFRELPPKAIATMPPGLRSAYLGELAVALDSCSGVKVIPYSEDNRGDNSRGVDYV